MMRQKKRKYIQLMAAVLYNCHLGGFLTGRISNGVTKGICVPGLNCYSCPGAVGACPLGSLQNSLTRSPFRLPAYVIGTILLFGVLFGRMVCGFLCPFGLLQELLHKLPFPKPGKNRFTRILSLLKYVILIIFVVLIPLTQFAPGFCKYICPAGTLEAGLPLIALNGMLRQRIGFLFSWKIFVLAACSLLCLLYYRGFCRFLCPLGALYSFFNPVSFFGIRRDPEKCTGCGACARHCKMDTKCVGDRECIRCGDCRNSCPEGAIKDEFYKSARSV